MKSKRQLRPFNVYIPNEARDGVVEIVPIKIPVRVDQQTGHEVLLPEAHELIERTRRERLKHHRRLHG